MIIYRLNQSEMKKYIELGTLDVKIGPLFRLLDVETSSLRFIIYVIATFRLLSLNSKKKSDFDIQGT